MKAIALALLLGAACAGLAPPAQAQSTSTSTNTSTKFYVTVKGHMSTPVGSMAPSATLTFSTPFEVPRASLPAGSYLFTMVSPGIMRVSSEDGSKVYSTFNTASATRSRNLSVPQVRFERAAPGAPLRLIGIYLEGAGSGYAPMYSHKERDAVATSGTVGGK